MSDSELLTPPEAADLFRIKVSTLRAWVLARRIPYVKVGRLVRFRRADIEATIQRNVVPAGRPGGRPVEDRHGH